MPMNVVKSIRLSNNLSLTQFAELARCSDQVVLRTEQGTYREVPPKILKLCEDLNSMATKNFVATKYREFTKLHRALYASRLDLDLSKYVAHRANSPHPLIYLRSRIGYATRMGFCVAFCMHPSTVRRFELGETLEIPEQVRELYYDISSVAFSHLNSLQEAHEAWRSAHVR